MTSIFISNPFRHANSANVERLTPIHHGTSGYRPLPCSTYLPCHSIWRGIWSQIEPDAVPSFHYVRTDNYCKPLLGMIKPTAIVFHYRFVSLGSKIPENLFTRQWRHLSPPTQTTTRQWYITSESFHNPVVMSVIYHCWLKLWHGSYISLSDCTCHTGGG